MSKCKTNLHVVFLTELIVIICEGSQSVNLPPWITSVFEPEYYVPAKHPTPLNLQCKAKNGIISYQWFKNNVKFQSNDQVVVNEQSGDITFHNLKEEDFGVYFCVAENKHGSSVSSFVKILEAALNDFRGNAHGNITCKIFHHCKIPCSNQPNCQPINACIFEWKSGKGTENTIKTDENVIVDSKGDLHFLSINRSYDSHNLSCGVWNEILKKFVKGTPYTVKIDENNDTVTSKAIWRNNPKARIGENATLQCTFSGSPVPNIDWLLRNGSVVKPNSKFQSEKNGRHLFIQNVTFDDDGVYTCVANKSNLTMNSYLNVTTPPIFADVGNRFMMRLIKFSHMEDIEIRCNAISAPNESEPVVFLWMRNGRNINKDPLYRFSEEKKNLHIGTNVPISENGDCFTCVIENSEGIGVANFILISKNKGQRQKVNYVVITVCSIAMVILVNIGVIIVKKKLFLNLRRVMCKAKVKDIPEEAAEAEEEPVYSDPVIELSENLYNSYCGEEVFYNTPQMSIHDYPENDYNVLREYKVEQADNNFYDCTENVSGTYNLSFRRNPQTILGLYDNLGSEESSTNT